MNVINHKEGRVSVKDVRRAGACEACRSRKRKCDGQEPCSSCVSKDWICAYAQQKKRGPPRKSAALGEQTNQLQVAQVVSPSTQDVELSDKLEALSLGNMYLKYVNAQIPATSREKLMSPTNSSHKVQSYAALAFTARVCGDLNKANKYISQGRMVAGDIYDLPDADSVSAMLMMAYYWQLVNNVPQSVHYSRMVTSLRKMLPENSGLDFRVDFMCEVNGILSDDNTSNQEKSKLLRGVSKWILTLPNKKKEHLNLMSSVTKLSSYVIGILNYNPMLIQIKDCHEFYHFFHKINLDEKARLQILEEGNKVAITCALLTSSDEEFTMQLNTIFSVFTPIFMALAEWRSGHVREALTLSITIIRNIQTLTKVDAFGFACGMLDYFIMGMMGGLSQFLLDIGQNALAAQMNDKIKNLCKLLSPEFDFVLKFTEEFDTWVSATDLPPSITLMEDEDEDDEPTKDTYMHGNFLSTNLNSNTNMLNNSAPDTTPTYIQISPVQIPNQANLNLTYMRPIYTFGSDSSPSPVPNYAPNPNSTFSSASSYISNSAPTPTYTSPSPNYSVPSPNFAPIPNYAPPSTHFSSPSPNFTTTYSVPSQNFTTNFTPPNPPIYDQTAPTTTNTVYNISSTPIYNSNTTNIPYENTVTQNNPNNLFNPNTPLDVSNSIPSDNANILPQFINTTNNANNINNNNAIDFTNATDSNTNSDETVTIIPLQYIHLLNPDLTNLDEFLAGL